MSTCIEKNVKNRALEEEKQGMFVYLSSMCCFDYDAAKSVVDSYPDLKSTSFYIQELHSRNAPKTRSIKVDSTTWLCDCRGEFGGKFPQ